MSIHSILTTVLKNVGSKNRRFNLCPCHSRKLLRYSQYRAFRNDATPNILLNKVHTGEVETHDARTTYNIERLRKYYRSINSENKINDLNAFKHAIPFHNLLDQLSVLNDEKEELISMKKESNDEEIDKMADGDLSLISSRYTLIETKILDILPSLLKERLRNEVIVEITPGAGGQEAMIFAGELLNMYRNYCYYSRWSVEEETDVSSSGFRNGTLLVNGKGSYQKLKFESGIHRVQRTPTTEKAGRIHTSTVSVVILPVPSKVEIDIKETDIRMETMRASGAGGQHVNTTDSAVRIRHLPTGTIITCQENRSQLKNREMALNKLRSKLHQEIVDKENYEVYSNRKLQVGTRGRSEKIRTYNYNQDRITDHRIPVTYHSVNSMLSGQDLLHKLITRLEDESIIEMLIDIVNSYSKDDK